MLITLGISHKTAPIAIREQLAFSPECIPSALQHLKGKQNIEEIALLSTCNRTELYCQAPSQEVVGTLYTWWQHYLETAFEAKPYAYLYCDREAVTHMMRVASGLDSMLLGEPQILGQLKSAYQMAQTQGTLGRQLARCFQMSFSVAKRVRTQTAIAKYPVSLAYAAVNLAKQIFTDLSKTRVLLIGAGENCELILQHLQAKSVSELSICNRTLENAQRLAQKVNGKAYSLSSLKQLVQEADIVISAINTLSPVIGFDQLGDFLKKKRRPKLMIDLGVPRNIAPDLGNHDDIYLYSVDDLQHILTENLKSRESAAIQAEHIIVKATDAFLNWLGAKHHHAQISQLRLEAADIQQQELNHALKALENGKDPATVLTQFAHRLTQKLLHQPTLSLRQAAEESIEVLELTE